MMIDEFIEKRKNKTFNINEVQVILKKLGYETKLVKTHCEGTGKWSIQAVNKFRAELDELKLTYFAYIKFYSNKDEKYALVAGKTNAWKDDVYFEYEEGLDDPKNVVYERKNKAKKWLKSKQNQDSDYRWYHEKVLIVWRSELVKDENEKVSDLKELENLAYSIEDDIGGLLGLFSS